MALPIIPRAAQAKPATHAPPRRNELTNSTVGAAAASGAYRRNGPSVALDLRASSAWSANTSSWTIMYALPNQRPWEFNDSGSDMAITSIAGIIDNTSTRAVASDWKSMAVPAQVKPVHCHHTRNPRRIPLPTPATVRSDATNDVIWVTENTKTRSRNSSRLDACRFRNSVMVRVVDEKVRASRRNAYHGRRSYMRRRAFITMRAREVGAARR